MALSGVHSTPSCRSDNHPPPPRTYDARMAEIIGAILAGGASSRMGENKAMVEIAGHPMSTWVFRAVEAAVSDSTAIVALGNTMISGVPSLNDRPGDGPLSGLAAVADIVEHLNVPPRAVLVVAVDHPWVRQGTLRGLVKRFDERAVIPIHHRVRQVTCAVYPISFVVVAAQGAMAGKGFQTLLERVEIDEVEPEVWAGWGEDGRSWFSVDTPGDIERGSQKYGHPGLE